MGTKPAKASKAEKAASKAERKASRSSASSKASGPAEIQGLKPMPKEKGRSFFRNPLGGKSAKQDGPDQEWEAYHDVSTNTIYTVNLATGEFQQTKMDMDAPHFDNLRQGEAADTSGAMQVAVPMD